MINFEVNHLQHWSNMKIIHQTEKLNLKEILIYFEGEFSSVDYLFKKCEYSIFVNNIWK